MAPPRPPTDIGALRRTLLHHARTVIARDGVDALTMRTLAGQSGMAVGMSYKAFDSREDLLRELALTSLQELADQIEEWASRSGGQLVDRLMEFADLQSASVAPALVAHLSNSSGGGEVLQHAVDEGVIRSWASVMTEFLQTRQREGTVRQDVDVAAFGFFITAALHYVLVTDEPFLAPARATLRQHVAGVATQIEGS
ncbi:TetR/AcrR family transcriptional regulator [Nocardioides carbamazepini]|jgi:AcrR family transcriptional regulator|uniref:TetR/AcrR family transcriptional regulator n=1 Tax=Nocardioides carbamazepini TaxID=2854259 RepID=UPI00214A0CC6|nr:TetR/AcrR family transcriptional regulator [Nocardioides carbamazepini]MCR1782959.1 TetR/AcrR family transcriptional regulator [Nocardioides carbamazepini]